MPKLSSIVQRLLIQCILKFDISLTKKRVKIYVVADVVEIEWFTGIKDNNLL